MEQFFDKIFSEYGLAVLVLCFVCWKLLQFVADERKERQQNVQAFLVATDKQTEAINKLSGILQRLAGKVGHDDDGD